MKRKHSPHKKILLAALPFLFSLLLAAIILLRFFGFGAADANPNSGLRSLADSTAVMQYAKSVKSDLKDLLAAVEESDTERMDLCSKQLDEDIEVLREELSRPIWGLAELTPKVGKEVATARELVDILGKANREILHPMIDMMKEYPLSSLKADGGFNVRTILRYLDFLDENMETISSVRDSLDDLDLSTLDSSGSIQGALEKLDALSALYCEHEDYVSAFRAILGNGEDRLYVFVAQNSAEIRASSGFPGSVGSLRIQDGVLSINKFKSVYSVFASNVPQAQISALEAELFTERLYTPWDACFCPDFERVAYIWSLAYEQKNGEAVNGVISAAPPVIQKLLALSDPITLSDGTVLDGETAVRTLQHDLYFKYVSASQQNISEGSGELDALFSEAASIAFERLISAFSVRNLSAYFQTFDSCVKERLLMVWMKDENEESLMRQAGMSGSLNSDENDPKLGIYFSGETSGKMGWYLDIVPVIGEPVVNVDGSCTYDVSITLSNVIGKEDLRTGGTYILGRNYTGCVAGDLTITAPAGGTIQDISTNWTRRFTHSSYQDLDTYYIHWLIVQSGYPITVEFTVTTAPGVDTPLGLLVTPTLTAYRGTDQAGS